VFSTIIKRFPVTIKLTIYLPRVFVSTSGRSILMVGGQIGCSILTTCFIGEEWRAAAGTAVGTFFGFGMNFGMREGGGIGDGGLFFGWIVSLAPSKAEVASRNDGRKTSSSL